MASGALRLKQLGAEVVGTFDPDSGALRCNQLGVEVVGAFSDPSSALQCDQLGVEIVGQWTPSGQLQLAQLGVEIVGTHKTKDRLRCDQLGVEVVGEWNNKVPPAGDYVGYKYYIGPGFRQGLVTEGQGPGFEPQSFPVQDLTFLGALEGTTVTATANYASNVPLTGSTPIVVTFPYPFVQACYWVGATYQPSGNDSSPIFVTCQITDITPQGFSILGVVLSGTAGQATGTFSWGAIGE